MVISQSSPSFVFWYLRSKRQAAPDTFRSSVHPANEVVPHLRRFFFRRLRRRGLPLVSPLCKGVARFPCSFRAVAATLAPLSPSPLPLPCTGGLLLVARAPALASVVAASSLHAPALRPCCCCCCTRPWPRQTACKQSPSRPATATDRNDPTPSTKHVSSLETYYSALRGGTSMRVQSPSP